MFRSFSFFLLHGLRPLPPAPSSVFQDVDWLSGFCWLARLGRAVMGWAGLGCALNIQAQRFYSGVAFPLILALSSRFSSQAFPFTLRRSVSLSSSSMNCARTFSGRQASKNKSRAMVVVKQILPTEDGLLAKMLIFVYLYYIFVLGKRKGKGKGKGREGKKERELRR